MDIFFCDIVGTYQGTSQNRKQEVKKFVKKVLKLVEIDQVDHIIFSFVSSENMEIVKSCIDEITPYLNDQIKLGIQFSESEIYFEGLIRQTEMSCKLDQILYVTRKLGEVKNIYFADDSEFIQTLVSDFFAQKYPQFNVISFVPGTQSTRFLYKTEQKGIDGLNKIMDQYIHMKKPITKPTIMQKVKRYS